MLIDADKLVHSVIGRSMFVNPSRYDYVDKLLDYRLHVSKLINCKRYPKGHFTEELNGIDEILRAFTN